MMKSLLEQAQEELKMDMTPMIDVVFLLIIFFLCIDFKILEAKLPAYLPKDKGAQTFQVDPMEQLSVKIIEERPGHKVARKEGHEPGVINPKSGRPYPYRLEGHRVRWEVGPRTISDLTKLKEELSRIASDKTLWQVDKVTNVPKPMPVVVEPAAGAVYEDVANTVDAVKAAGFVEINFGGGMGGKAPGTQR
jgi:biopolymer transport protein ExbD